MSKCKLDASYASLRLQLGAHDYAKSAALRPTATGELLNQLGLPDLVGTIVKNRSKTILEQFDQVGRQIRRQGFVDLVSSFEADLFRLLRMATSQARHVLNGHYDASGPFAAHREDLVRTTADFSNLGGYRRLLATPSPSQADPRADLWTVVSHRDFLVHGERWDFTAHPPTIDFAYRTLSNEIDRIEATR